MWSVVTLSPSSARQRAPDVLQRLRFARQPLEERWPTDVGGAGIPGEALSTGHLERVPALVAVEHMCVALAEHVRLHRPLHNLGDLLGARPDVPQVDRLPPLILAERLRVE